MNDCVFKVRDQEVVTRRIGDETVIVPLSRSVGELNFIYTLNQPATVVWELLRAGTSVPEILNTIRREYDVAEEVASEDIKEFLDSLKTAGLIHSSIDSGG